MCLRSIRMKMEACCALALACCARCDAGGMIRSPACSFIEWRVRTCTHKESRARCRWDDLPPRTHAHKHRRAAHPQAHAHPRTFLCAARHRCTACRALGSFCRRSMSKVHCQAKQPSLRVCSRRSLRCSCSMFRRWSRVQDVSASSHSIYI